MTIPAVTTAVPDHCEDILSYVEIKDKWNCRACSRARFYAQNIPRLTIDDTMIITMESEVEFRNVNWPIQTVTPVGNNKYEITFQSQGKFLLQITFRAKNLAFESEFDGHGHSKRRHECLCRSRWHWRR